MHEADLVSGALAERNTFQGERCIYNALNDRIRNLLLQYDFSKSSDPYVYWSSHITSLMNSAAATTSDITLSSDSRSFALHKFLLACRSPYFWKKLEAQPETATWKLAPAIPIESLHIVLRYLYLADLPRELVGPNSAVSEEEVLSGLDKITKQLEVEQLWEAILGSSDRRMARQRYEDEVRLALAQVRNFFQSKIVGHRMEVDIDRVDEVKWKHDNAIWADVLLRADELESEPDELPASGTATPRINGHGIPIGPAQSENGETRKKRSRRAVLYPAHQAMLIRSEYFATMFSGDFVEARKTDNLRIVTVDCSPEVLELVLAFLYTESTACPLEHALDLLYAADMLLLDDLKNKAAMSISTLGSGNRNALVNRTHTTQLDANGQAVDVEPINIYDAVHAAWDLRVQRLEEFAARYIAHRLEDYIDELEFQELIRESASRLQKREATDSIELLDDIRYYLSERFRLRFEDVGLEDMIDETGELNAETAVAIADEAEKHHGATENGGTEEHAQSTTNREVANGDGAAVTLDGEAAEDEFASDAINYQLLLNKIDIMLDRLQLDA